MYNDRGNGYNNRPGGFNRPGEFNRDDRNRASSHTITAEPLPEDYVKRAEEAIAELERIENQDKRKVVITTSKLRSLFSLFTETFNEVTRGDQKKLDKDQLNDLNVARVRIYYEIGREDRYNGDMDSAPVGRFVQQSGLLAYLGDIGDSCDKLKQFYHYMEALVAFHRYYFGEKKDRS